MEAEVLKPAGTENNKCLNRTQYVMTGSDEIRTTCYCYSTSSLYKVPCHTLLFTRLNILHCIHL